MVSLNVGGRRFDTTKETLSRASYFLPYLEGQLSILPTEYLHHHHPLQGRLDHAADEDGRLCIDQDPDVFAVLLQFMRQRLAKTRTTIPTLLVRDPCMVA